MAEAGLALPPSFLERVQRITALNLFARAFPVWLARTGRTASFRFHATADGGVEIDLGMPADTPADQVEELLDLLEKFQRLADLETIVSEMRQAGVEDAQVQPYAMEGEVLAAQVMGNTDFGKTVGVPRPSGPTSLPVSPSSRVCVERGLLGEKWFESEQAYEAWRRLPWWQRLKS